MITAAESTAASAAARGQRLQLAELLQVKTEGANKADLELAARVKLAISKGDGAAYDKALADAAVAGLFRRGVLHFGEASP